MICFISLYDLLCVASRTAYYQRYLGFWSCMMHESQWYATPTGVVSKGPRYLVCWAHLEVEA
jgi:hypothetical protein